MTAESKIVTRNSLRFGKIIDFILLNPGVKSSEVANHIGHSDSYTRHLMGSDAFKEQLAIRVRENQLFVGATLVSKTQELIEATLGTMIEQVKDQGTVMPHAELRETADVMLQRLGYVKGAEPAAQGAGPSVQVNIDGDLLTRARERAAERRGIVDVTPELPAEGGSNREFIASSTSGTLTSTDRSDVS